jgi:RNA-directed DNA polymerase
MVKRKGRNLKPGQVKQWTRQWFVGLGLHQLMGTIRYPGTA